MKYDRNVKKYFYFYVFAGCWFFMKADPIHHPLSNCVLYLADSQDTLPQALFGWAERCDGPSMKSQPRKGPQHAGKCSCPGGVLPSRGQVIKLLDDPSSSPLSVYIAPPPHGLECLTLTWCRQNHIEVDMILVMLLRKWESRNLWTLLQRRINCWIIWRRFLSQSLFFLLLLMLTS